MPQILYDAHVHLSDPHYSQMIPHMLQGMRQMNIVACCVSTGIKDSRRTMMLAGDSDSILPFVGIHPQFAPGADPAGIEEMAGEGVAGIGEIGLDPTYPGHGQSDVFEAQLEIAERLDLPVSVHSRKSLEEILETLTSYRCRVLLHWFEGRRSRLRRAMDMGLYVSYGPLMVYASDKRRLLSLSRTDRILFETDGPVRFARCFADLSAQPAFLPSVVHAAARTLGLTYTQMLKTAESNAEAYLGIRYN